MRRVIVLIFLLWMTLASCSSETMLPMASFTVATSNQDVILVWEKVGESLLSNGFSFSGNKNQDTKEFSLKSDQGASVILSKNAKNNFVEVVFIHFKKSEFGAEEERIYNNLKIAITQAVSDHKVLDSVPFQRGKPVPLH